MVEESPFYSRVPKDLLGNLAYRRKVIEYGSRGRTEAQEIWTICKRDILFYVNAFLFLVEPRQIPGGKKVYPIVPFITYPYQDKCILQLKGALGQQDVLIEKSRDVGASWMCLSVFEHAWHFEDMLSFLLVSRKEDLVDKKGDPDALMWKIDHMHLNMPAWLLPAGRTGRREDKDRTELHLANPETGSVIDGAATTGDVSVGGRRTAVLLDEFAKVKEGSDVLRGTRDTTNCRIFNSTPEGKANAFYEQREAMAREGGQIITLHWTLHPIKAKGLYKTSQGKDRSPWYDLQCKRAASAMEIAQELDIDYLGSSYQYFDAQVLEVMEKEFIRPPVWRGELVYLDGAIPDSAVQRDNGRLELWAHVGDNGRLVQRGLYVAGADIAQGSFFAGKAGASNSVIAFGDPVTREKIGQLRTHSMDPVEFANYAVALCRWLSQDDETGVLGAYLGWESNGSPGLTFGKQVMKLGYRNIYYNLNEKSDLPRPSTNPGWFSTKETKNSLFEQLAKAWKERQFIVRSADSIREAREYVWAPDGTICHQSAHSEKNPAQARAQHGDTVIADGILWKLMEFLKLSPQEPTVSQNEGNSIGARREARKAKARTENMW